MWPRVRSRRGEQTLRCSAESNVETRGMRKHGRGRERILSSTKSKRELLNVTVQIFEPHMPQQPAYVGQRRAPKKKLSGGPRLQRTGRKAGGKSRIDAEKEESSFPTLQEKILTQANRIIGGEIGDVPFGVLDEQRIIQKRAVRGQAHGGRFSGQSRRASPTIR